MSKTGYIAYNINKYPVGFIVGNYAAQKHQLSMKIITPVLGRCVGDNNTDEIDRKTKKKQIPIAQQRQHLRAIYINKVLCS